MEIYMMACISDCIWCWVRHRWMATPATKANTVDARMMPPIRLQEMLPFCMSEVKPNIFRYWDCNSRASVRTMIDMLR